MKRSPLKRKSPLRRQGARAKRQESAEREFRRAVLERCTVSQPARSSDGLLMPRLYQCERCKRRQFQELDAHHLKPRSRGGKHEASNGAGLCGGPDGCHRKIHDHVVADWREWVR